VRGFQDDRRRHPGVQSLLPSADAEAPTVSGGEAGKAELRVGCDQVISSRARKLQKLRSHDRANCVQSNIAGAGSAKAIAIEPGGRPKTAAL
jgi:hypothetical protein